MTITVADVPQQLNGYPVIAVVVNHSGSRATVMVDRTSVEPKMPYVVASWWPELGKTWNGGDYSSDRKDADHDFDRRVHANASRL